MKRLVAGVLAVLVLALSACGNRDEPIDVVTPTPWGTPTPKAMVTDDVEEAGADYEETYATFRSLAESGGAPEPPPRLMAMASGPFLESASLVLRTLFENGYRLSPGSRAWVANGEPRDNGTIRLRTCEDLTQADYVDQAGEVAMAMDSKRFQHVVLMRRHAEGWVVSEAESTGLSTWSESGWCQ